MAIDIKVPQLPESVADATIATWHVKPGDKVSRDQNLVDIETDKVVLEVVAEAEVADGLATFWGCAYTASTRCQPRHWHAPAPRPGGREKSALSREPFVRGALPLSAPWS